MSRTTTKTQTGAGAEPLRQAHLKREVQNERDGKQ